MPPGVTGPHSHIQACWIPSPGWPLVRGASSLQGPWLAGWLDGWLAGWPRVPGWLAGVELRDAWLVPRNALPTIPDQLGRPGANINFID